MLFALYQTLFLLNNLNNRNHKSFFTITVIGFLQIPIAMAPGSQFVKVDVTSFVDVYRGANIEVVINRVGNLVNARDMRNRGIVSHGLNRLSSSALCLGCRQGAKASTFSKQFMRPLLDDMSSILLFFLRGNKAAIGGAF